MDDLQQFKDTYLTECFELLEEMEEKLLSLADSDAVLDDLNAIFRCAHSIKGGAGAFGFDRIQSFTHTLETLLDHMREETIGVSPEVIDTLLRSRDVVFQLVSAAQQGEMLPDSTGEDIEKELLGFSPGAAPISSASDTPNAVEAQEGEHAYTITFTPHGDMLAHGNEPLLLLRELASLGRADIRCNTAKLPPLEQLVFDECYVSWEIKLITDKGEDAIKEVFEFVEDECDLNITKQEQADAPKDDAPKTASTNNAPTAAGAPTTPATTSIRVNIDKVDQLINMVGEVVITQAFLSAQTSDLPPQEFAELIRSVDEMMHHTRELQEAVMAIRMQPVKSIFSRMPRIVRDLSGQLGKDIVLEMSGENTEVDKTIIEQLSDPLTHMIRNSVDHGVETPDIREAAGKPRQGTIHLAAEHRGGRIVIEIIDDGAGINREKVLGKAIEKGIVPEEHNLSDEEIDMLIFAAGFSTAETVSNVSGRGVGMDVVRRNIEGLGGSVHIENRPGEGSTFAISLPLTLAILDGMIIRCGEEYYIIPINNIIETLRPASGDVRRIADGNAVINVRGEFIPVIYLHEVFGTQHAERDASKGLVVLVENGTQQLGIVVDELVGQQQVVIKSLEENADPVQGISGATILGDGKVSLILDIGQLYRANHTQTTPPPVMAEAA